MATKKKTIYTETEPVKRLIIPRFITKSKKYYLYAHTRPDNNDIFYFGVGTMDKGNSYYRATCHKKRNSFWKRIVNKVKEYTIFIIDESDNKEEILSKEIEYIKLMGKRCNKTGTLCNLTDGGEGLRGHKVIWTKEMREMASERMRNRETKQSTRQKLRENIYKSTLIGRRGEDNYISRPVLQIDKNSLSLIQEYISIKEAADKMKVSHQSIQAACSKGFKSKGFIWRYKYGK